MRYLSLLIIALTVLGCSKDNFNPDKPKDGQIVELFADHYQGASMPMIFLSPGKETSPLSLAGFEDRKLGYTYKIKAKVVVPKVAPADGPDKWFEFVEVISKEAYKGNESFVVSLKNSTLFFGSFVSLKKENDKYIYIGYTLRPKDEIVKKQLEAVLLLQETLMKNQDYASKVTLTANVNHDPENLEKGYLVNSVTIVEPK